MKRIILFSIISFLSFGSIAQTGYPIFEDPINVTQFKLKNGLTVVLSENHEKPTIMGAVVVKAGGKNDPADATGIAHYLEHMLFKGTQDFGTVDFSKEKVYLDKIDSLYEILGQTKDQDARLLIQKQINEQSIKAGEFAIPNEMEAMLSEIGSKGVNAFTSNDMTVYHNEFPSNKLEEWLSIYSHRFVNPVFRLFQSELETVYEEKNRGLESPFTYAFETFMKGFFKKHPYGTQTVIGETEHLKNPSLKKMYEYYNTYYVANNMVLIMSGDFDTEVLRPLIEQYFSEWRSGDVPKFPTYQEDDFKKDESITIKATPIKAMARGYRTPKFGQYDALILEMVANILNNDQRSGLFDELVDEGKVMTIQGIYEPMNDYGASIFLVIPKIIGQSFDNANQLLDETLQRLTTGDFSDDLFEGAKNQWILDYDTQLEGNTSRTYLLAEVYGAGMEWYEYVNYIKAIKTITKEQLVEVAKKYYSQNYFTLYSKMGSKKPEKLTKPGFEPVIPKNDGEKSAYYQAWKSIHTDKEAPELISLKEKVNTSTLSNGSTLYAVSNPINDIFNFDIVWKMGIRENANLEKLAEFLNKATPSKYSLNEFKNKLYALGTTIDWNAGEHTFTLSVSGLDNHLAETITLIKELLELPIVSSKQIKNIAKQIRVNRTLNIKEPQYMARVLAEYARYGKDSRFLLQPSYKDYKKTTTEDVDQLYKMLSEYQVEYQYVGNANENDIMLYIKQLGISNGEMSNSTYLYPASNEEADVYFLDYKKSVQSHIYFLGTGSKMNRENTLLTNSFNYYFGFDMSSILFQEIREFRSLAYSTYGYVGTGRNPQTNDLFTSYVGCQGDKTKESAEILHQLIKDMPVKTDRKETLINSLTNVIENSNPTFRDYIQLYETSLNRGYDDNYFIQLKNQLKDFNFEKMVEYYQKEIQPLKLKMSILGNSKSFDATILNGYGKVKKMKQKQVFNF